MKIRYYRRDGSPIGLFEWARLLENVEYVRIAKTELKNVLVSTVWLGLDHSFSFDHTPKPVIFETMVFPHGSLTPLYCERYSTEAEAIVGHEMTVDRWKERSTFIGKCKTEEVTHILNN